MKPWIFVVRRFCSNDHLATHFSHLDIHFSHLATHFSHLDIHFSHLDTHFFHLDTHFSHLDTQQVPTHILLTIMDTVSLYLHIACTSFMYLFLRYPFHVLKQLPFTHVGTGVKELLKLTTTPFKSLLTF